MLRFFIIAAVAVSAGAVKQSTPFPPDPDLVISIHCTVDTAPDKPGFMPGWYVRVATNDVRDRKWQRLLNVYTPDRLKEATAECADYLLQIKKAAGAAAAERKPQAK